MSGNIHNRRNWTRSLTVLVLIVVIAALISGLTDKDQQKNDRFYLVNSAGAVLFDHQQHQESADSCAQCHHQLYSAEQATSCEDCHDDEFVADEYSHGELKEIHSLDCAKCHEQVEDNDVAASCRECHPASQSNVAPIKSCAECHDDSYLPEMMTHDEYTEISDHSCLGCHSPGSISEVYHASCTNCHLETIPERFTTTDGELSCGACHLR